MIKIPLLEEIKHRFDSDVERFSNLQTGQLSTIGTPLAMELITQAAVRSTKAIRNLLDIGCGAGNNTIKLLNYTSLINCNLADLSQAMLKKAKERIEKINTGKINTFSEDFRSVKLPNQKYDIILATAVFHHLCND